MIVLDEYPLIERSAVISTATRFVVETWETWLRHSQSGNPVSLDQASYLWVPAGRACHDGSINVYTIAMFSDYLAERVNADIRKGSDVEVYTEYQPGRILEYVCAQSGINPSVLPRQTFTSLFINGQRPHILVDSPTWTRFRFWINETGVSEGEVV